MHLIRISLWCEPVPTSCRPYLNSLRKEQDTAVLTYADFILWHLILFFFFLVLLTMKTLTILLLAVLLVSAVSARSFHTGKDITHVPNLTLIFQETPGFYVAMHG